MAVRNKQDRRKKPAPAQKSAPQEENLGESSQAPEAREHEELPSPKTLPARSRHTPAEQRHDVVVRKSTLYLTAALCLLLGVYLGTLLSAVRGFQNGGVASVQPDPQQAPAPAGQRTDDGLRLRELEEAVKKNPQQLHAWIQLGNQYFDDNEPREAIRAYERALSIQKDNPDVLTDMGIMYRQLGEFEQAAKTFTQASRINPLHEQSRFNLGVVLFFDLNRKDEARRIWRALIGINPEARTPDGALLRTMLDELK
jgi:cytochrome c-type biogenesis protein CcmH/NrfG